MEKVSIADSHKITADFMQSGLMWPDASKLTISEDEVSRGYIHIPEPQPLMGRIDLEKQDITFFTDGKERLRITADGKFIVNSIVEVDTATDADKIYYALRDVFLKGK